MGILGSIFNAIGNFADSINEEKANAEAECKYSSVREVCNKVKHWGDLKNLKKIAAYSSVLKDKAEKLSGKELEDLYYDYYGVAYVASTLRDVLSNKGYDV